MKHKKPSVWNNKLVGASHSTQIEFPKQGILPFILSKGDVEYQYSRKRLRFRGRVEVNKLCKSDRYQTSSFHRINDKSLMLQIQLNLERDAPLALSH